MPSQNEIIRDRLNKINIENGFGSLTHAYTDFLRGLNHRGVGNQLNTNRDNVGMVFFTRPNLNLSYDNLAAHRMLMPFATQTGDMTLQRYVRTLLDPKGALFRDVTSPLVDHTSPFIPLLTNTLMSSSGWPDIAVDTYDSKEGIRKEQWSIVDGVYKVNNTFSLSVNFANVLGDPVSALFQVWLMYAVSVRLGEMLPYPESIVEREIDYQTGIYHLILDPSRRYIQKIARTIAYPTAIPMGNNFNFTGDQPFVNDNATISTQFKCIGADYNDPILFEEFNDLAAIYNPGLTITSIGADGTLSITGNYIQLSSSEVKKYNNHGYPLIHPITHELTWWVSTDTYQSLSNEA